MCLVFKLLIARSMLINARKSRSLSTLEHLQHKKVFKIFTKNMRMPTEFVIQGHSSEPIGVMRSKENQMFDSEEQ